MMFTAHPLPVSDASRTRVQSEERMRERQTACCSHRLRFVTRTGPDNAASPKLARETARLRLDRKCHLDHRAFELGVARRLQEDLAVRTGDAIATGFQVARDARRSEVRADRGTHAHAGRYARVARQGAKLELALATQHRQARRLYVERVAD